MPILANLDRLATKPDQAFNVELVRRNPPNISMLLRNSLRLKYNNVTAFRWTKVVSHTIHKQMIARANLKPDPLLPFMKNLRRRQPCFILKCRDAWIPRFPEIRWKPNRVRH